MSVFHKFFSQIKGTPQQPGAPCLKGRNGEHCGETCAYGNCWLLTEKWFTRMVSLERKRTERSRIPFLLILLDLGRLGLANGDRDQLALQVAAALSPLTRETDLIGWFETGSIVGALFPDLSPALDAHAVVNPILSKVVAALTVQLGSTKASRIRISWHLFPEAPSNDEEIPADTDLYPDVLRKVRSHRAFRAAKRIIDIAGSVIALIVLTPLMAVIAVLVKLTSDGPAIFRQERLGQFGQTFTCYKFRTMYVDNDVKIHQEFISHVIKGDYKGNGNGNGNGNGHVHSVYKMTDDPRVTSIGRILRRSSLDEIPQFFNVLKGDMSLVGPRPPLSYEYLQYDLWQRRRIVESKPGITGLWQVKGRSRVRFEDMVRLDLRYGSSSSIWLDMQILMETPRAVLLGDGAF